MFLYPMSSYLVRGRAPRLRVLDEHGRPDPAAIARARLLAPVIPIDEPTRERALTALSRYAPLMAPNFVAKGAVAFGDAEDAGLSRDVGGLTVFIERPEGTVRTGTGPNGETWETTMQADYGFLPMTVCASDGEEIDAYVGKNLAAPFVWVVSQLRQDGSFDEPKLMLGFDSEEDAVRCYLAHVPEWCFGGVTQLPVSLIAGLMNIEPDGTAKTLKGAATSPASPAPMRYARKIAKAGPQLRRCMSWHDGDDEEECEDPYDCEEDPYYEFMWADGRAHAWFCQSHAKQWLAASEREVVRARRLTGGTASKRFGDAPGERMTNEDVAMVAKDAVSVGLLADGGLAQPTQVPKLEGMKIEGEGGELGFTDQMGDRSSTAKEALALSFDAHLSALRGESPAGPTEQQMKEARVEKTARAFSVVKGWWASTSHIGQALPLAEAPPEVARAVTSSPLTENYPNPDDVGGWLGVIEPEDQSWIAFVAVDGRTLFWTQRESDGGVVGMPYYTYRLDLATTSISEAVTKGFRPIMKFRVNWLGPDASEIRIAKDAAPSAGTSAKVKRRIVYGVVLEPEPCDGQGDSQAHTYDPDFVRDACHYYSQFRLINLDHKGAPIDPARARVVEIYIAPVDFVLDTPRGPQEVKRGSWVMGTEILCDELWALVEAGKWNAYSVEGFSRSEPIEGSHWNVKQVHCRSCSATWKTSVQKDRPFPPVVVCPRCHQMASTASN